MIFRAFIRYFKNQLQYFNALFKLFFVRQNHEKILDNLSGMIQFKFFEYIGF